MSYYISGYGNIVFKEDVDISEMKRIVQNSLDDFEDLSVVVEGENELSIGFYEGHDYCDLETVLTEIADKVEEGSIECDGEDHCFWKLEFDCGKWKTYNGIKTYERYGREL